IIVWRVFAFTFYNSGGKYNPVTESWTATSTANAPEGRTRHTAVWTGSELLVWGGYFFDLNGDHYVNTGGRYNPVNDSWMATSTTNAPDARISHTAVWTGSQMIVWGGLDQNLVLLNTGAKYNPITDSWTATSTTSAPEARTGHTAIWTGSNMIVWGGGNGSVAFNTGARYDPGTNSWTATSTDTPVALEGHRAVWTGSQMIVWGGDDGTN